MSEKKPLNHPDYECWPGGPANFAKWSRENIPKPEPRYKVGDFVRINRVVEITKVYKDCDGTPLYAIDMTGYGLCEERLTPATQQEWEEDN